MRLALSRLGFGQYTVVIVLSEPLSVCLCLGAPPSLERRCRQHGRLVICKMMSPQVFVDVSDIQSKLVRAPSFADINQKKSIEIIKNDVRIWDKYVA